MGLAAIDAITLTYTRAASLRNQLFERQSSSTDAGSSEQVMAGGITLPQAPLSLVNLITPESPETRFKHISSSPDTNGATSGGHARDGDQNEDSSDPLMGLLFSGWNPDLPDPAVLNH